MSYIIDNLYLSSVFEVKSYNLYEKSSLIVNAANEVLHNSPHDCTILNLNWYDTPSQDINKGNLLFKIIDFMDMFLSDNKIVVVNCYAGISRSTTIVLAYLIYKFKWSLEESLSYVRNKRHIINPNEGFMRQLKNIETSLKNHNIKCLETYIKCPPINF